MRQKVIIWYVGRVGIVLYCYRTKIMKSGLRFLSNCNLKKCNFVALRYANLKSPAFCKLRQSGQSGLYQKNLMRHSFIGFPTRNLLGLQNENELRS